MNTVHTKNVANIPYQQTAQKLPLSKVLKQKVCTICPPDGCSATDTAALRFHQRGIPWGISRQQGRTTPLKKSVPIKC